MDGHQSKGQESKDWYLNVSLFLSNDSGIKFS